MISCKHLCPFFFDLKKGHTLQKSVGKTELRRSYLHLINIDMFVTDFVKNAEVIFQVLHQYQCDLATVNGCRFVNNGKTLGLACDHLFYDFTIYCHTIPLQYTRKYFPSYQIVIYLINSQNHLKRTNDTYFHHFLKDRLKIRFI